MFDRTRRFFRRRADATVNYGGRVVGAREIKSNWSFITGMWDTLRLRKPRREETFANAYMRLGLTEEALERTHRYYFHRFYIILVFAAVALGMTLYSMLTGSWMNVGPGIGFMAIAGALLFNASFRLYQIERRELVDISAWAHAPNSWLPAPFRARSAPAPSTSAAIVPLRGKNPSPSARGKTGR